MRRGKYLGFLILTLLFLACFVLPVQNVGAQDKKKMAAAKKLVADGDTLYRQKDYQAAIQKYQEALKIVPNYPYAYFSKGYSHYYLKEYDQAAEDMNTAFMQQYPPLEVYKIRWNIYYNKKDYDNALKDIQEAIKLEPSNGYFYTAQGDIYREKSLDKEALESYVKASELDPNNPDLQYYMAVIYNKDGKFTEQGAASLKAVEKGTKYPGEAWFLRGDALQRERKFPEAADAYERALIGKPDNIKAYENLSAVYVNMAQNDKAITTVKKGLTASPENAELYITLSWLYSMIEKNADSIIAAKQAVKFAPQNYLGYVYLCRAYIDTTQYQIGSDQCKKALELKPEDGYANFYLARSFDFQRMSSMANEYYKKSVTGLTETVANKPQDFDGYYLLGNAYSALNDRQNAIEAYKKSLDLNPKFAKVLFNLGYIYHLNGNKDLAQAQRDELSKLDPASAEKLSAIINQK